MSRVEEMVKVCAGCKHLRVARDLLGKFKYAGCVCPDQIRRFIEQNKIIFRDGPTYKVEGEDVIPVALHPEYTDGRCYEQ
jgi:hypothetical protein